MKREWAAGLLLAAMLVFSGWNLRSLDRFTCQLNLSLEQSKQAVMQEDWELAEAKLLEAMALWEERMPYLSIFIRHSEIDSAADCFYELHASLIDKELGSNALYDRLSNHLKCIKLMEHLGLGSLL